MSIINRLLFFSLFFCSSQNQYPKDYFLNPISGELVLSGTFAELRSNHFHSGIDIKTNGVEGLSVFSSAEGYVSRIKVSHYGYGKAVYITHPNGYTSVYAHLQKFCPKIEAFVKSKQYEIEEYEIQLFPKNKLLEINRNELIGFSGNTGGSSGPHLHFEIRDNKERPINPMMFGIHVDDTIKPSIYELYVYPQFENSDVIEEEKRKKIKLIKISDGNYVTPTVVANGLIGFGVVANDKQNNAMNKNGVASIKSYYNSEKYIEINFNRFSFDESKHINRYIDYYYYKKNKKRIQKLFIEKNNPLSIFSYNKNKGLIRVLDSTKSIFSIDILDYKGNKTNIRIPIKAGAEDLTNQNKDDKYKTHIISNKNTILGNELIYVEIPPKSFYDDVNIDFLIHNDTIKIHEPTIPLQKSIEINFNIKKNFEGDKKYLFIGSINKKGKIIYNNTNRIGDFLKTKTRNLGTYTIGIDRKAPSIKAKNFKSDSWISNNKYLKIKITDDISGIKNYRATVNGDWILMEYDPKTNTLTHDFNDGIINSTENKLELIVTDNVGNSSKFESNFYRKLKD